MADITLGGNPCKTSGDVPAAGTAAPAFNLTARDLSAATLDSFSGKKVLNIFPSINTGVCSMSVRTFNERAANVDGVTVVNVSADLPFAANTWCGTEGLDNVVHLSTFRDRGAFAEAYGVGIVDGKFGGLLARAVVVVDENNNVIHSELVPEIGQAPNFDAALAALS